MTAAINPPLKWFGGKRYMTGEILKRMPRHLHYVEPFFGGGRVLFARNPDDPSLWPADHQTNREHRGVSELVNDLHGPLTNFWRVLRDLEQFPLFIRQVQCIPLSRTEWDHAHRHEYGKDPVADAVAFFVDCRQSWAGQMETFTPPTRVRARRQMNGNVSEWLTAVDGLTEVHARLRRVMVENMDALKLIPREDSPDTFFYCDAPYLHETRTATEVYAHEMPREEHERLLDVLLACQGKVMLSGYLSDLCATRLKTWNRFTKELPNNAAGGKKKRRMTEVLWWNYDCSRQLENRP